jgi:unsaturated rhamnogalacturonyl hydrolase
MMENLKAIAGKVWGHMKKDHSGNWGMDIDKWDWVPGVGVIALLEYGEKTDEAEVRSYLLEWVNRNRDQAAPEPVINAVAPYAIFPVLYKRTGEEWLKEEAARVAKWIVEKAPRTREQAFEHTVTENANFPEQVWADTVFMAVLFLARTATLIGDKAHAEEAQRQVLLHLRLLEDAETGVLFHGWNCAARDHMSAARWTRANAWIAVGVPMIVKEIEQLVPIEEELRERYRRLMDGLVGFQQPDGLWSTVLDRPDYYREISGSAGIACGLWLAAESGLLPDEEKYAAAARKALHAILSHIDDRGEVGGVSSGTPVMESIEAYNAIPIHPTLYGQGLTLMLLSEAIRRGEAGDE